MQFARARCLYQHSDGHITFNDSVMINGSEALYSVFVTHIFCSDNIWVSAAGHEEGGGGVRYFVRGADARAAATAV